MPLQASATSRLQQLADDGGVRILRILADRAEPEGLRARLLQRRILIAFAHEGFIRNFRDVIVTLAERGVHVLIALSKQHSSISIDDYDFLSGPQPAADVVVCENLKETSAEVERFRVLRDILHLASPAFDEAPDVRERFADQQGGVISTAKIRRLQALAAAMPAKRRKRWIKRVTARENAAPPTKGWSRLLKAFKPHLVVVSPYVHYESREIGLIKAARRRFVRSLLAVASWDNLTNKGVMKVRPDRVSVWNEAMAREAVCLHGVAAKRVGITGAPVFDRWFSREPQRSRKEFCRALGLPHEPKIVLYLCSSHSITGGAEKEVVARVLDGVRTASAGILKRANVLIRPHPMAVNVWSKFADESGAPIGQFKSAVVWPIAPKHPTGGDSDEAFFETLYYADAIVALNTSAMIEAAILNKPVFTFVDHEAAGHQTGNLHFRHLTETGMVTNVASVGDLVAKLEAYLLETERVDVAQTEAVVRTFVRPIAGERSASDVLADLVLHHAGARPRPLRTWLEYDPHGSPAVEEPRSVV